MVYLGGDIVAVPQPRGLSDVLGTNLEPFLRGFQDGAFQAEVAAFVEHRALDFAVPCPDGSHPLAWHTFHKEYRALFDRRFAEILEDLDVEREELIEWMDALRHNSEGLEETAELPGTGGLLCRNFGEFLRAVTASEEYEHFVWVMFRAAAEQWRQRHPLPPPLSELAVAAGQAAPLQDVEVAVPEGVGPGDALMIEFLGNAYHVVVPDGCFPGGVFRVTVQLVAAPLRLVGPAQSQSG